jgi:hypothetical protein
MGKGMQRLENPALPRIGFKEKRHRQSLSATPAALYAGNTGGKATRSPQLKGVEARHSFSAQGDPS